MIVGFARFLVERQLDAEMNDAARSSFDRLKQHVLKWTRTAWAESWLKMKSGTAERKAVESDLASAGIRTGLRWDDPQLSSTEMKAIAERLIEDFYGAMSRGMDMSIVQTRGTSRPAMSVLAKATSPSILVLPPSIRKSQLSRMTSSDDMKVSFLENRGGGAGAFFRDPRHSLDPLRMSQPSPDPPLIGIFNEVCLGRTFLTNRVVRSVWDSRWSSRAAREGMKAHLEAVEQQLETVRSHYVHEYTHLLDATRYKGAQRSQSIVQGAKAGSILSSGIPFSGRSIYDVRDKYYKSDWEWNAFFMEASDYARSMMKAYLVSSMSDATAYAALILLSRSPSHSSPGSRSPEDVFNDPSQSSKRNAMIQSVVLRLVGRMERRAEMASRQITVPNMPKTAGNAPVGGKWGKLVLVSMGVSATDALMAWMNDDKLRRKAAARIYSTAREIEEIERKFLADVGAGKAVPSKAEWSRAISMIRGDPSGIWYSKDENNSHFLPTRSTEPYSPKKKYYMLDAPSWGF